MDNFFFPFLFKFQTLPGKIHSRMSNLDWYDVASRELGKIQAMADILITVDPGDLNRETISSMGGIINECAERIAERL